MSEKRDNKIKEFMKFRGNVEPSNGEINILGQMASKYENKSEEELFDELQRLNGEMAKEKEKYKRNMDSIDHMKGFLDEEQKRKLDKIIDFLNPSVKER